MYRYTVKSSSFHGSEILYEGSSEAQAIKAARRYPCSKWHSDCKCGGAVITRTDGNTVEQCYQWEAKKPFTYGDRELFWIVKG